MDEDRADPEDEYRTEYEIFMRGKWTTSAPKRAGLYYIADREGDIRGVATVDVSLATGKLYAIVPGQPAGEPHKVHLGWWWSKPCPRMPLPPDWKE